MSNKFCRYLCSPFLHFLWLFAAPGPLLLSLLTLLNSLNGLGYESVQERCGHKYTAVLPRFRSGASYGPPGTQPLPPQPPAQSLRGRCAVGEVADGYRRDRCPAVLPLVLQSFCFCLAHGGLLHPGSPIHPSTSSTLVQAPAIAERIHPGEAPFTCCSWALRLQRLQFRGAQRLEGPARVGGLGLALPFGITALCQVPAVELLAPPASVRGRGSADCIGGVLLLLKSRPFPVLKAVEREKVPQLGLQLLQTVPLLAALRSS